MIKPCASQTRKQVSAGSEASGYWAASHTLHRLRFSHSAPPALPLGLDRLRFHLVWTPKYRRRVLEGPPGVGRAAGCWKGRRVLEGPPGVGRAGGGPPDRVVGSSLRGQRVGPARAECAARPGASSGANLAQRQRNERDANPHASPQRRHVSPAAPGVPGTRRVPVCPGGHYFVCGR